MRVVFFGTPAWAVPSLTALADSPGTDVVAVVTNPDRPAGRGLKLRPSPVKERALELGIPVEQPERVRDEAFISWLGGLAPAVCVVVAYGKILPLALLEVPARGFVNVHFSLLPEYRGAAPVQQAIVDGRTETGVSLMVLTEGMDEGPVLAQESTPIGPEDNAASVGERLAEAGAKLLADVLPRYVAGEIEPRAQDDASATYAPKLANEDSAIDWTQPADAIVNLVRGLDPIPGAWTTLGDQRLRVFRAAVSPDTESLEPGELVNSGSALVVGTGSVPVRVVEAQLAGRRRMSGQDLARGLEVERVVLGER